ncbi:MAG: AIPR family protein [bacterium]|nr:AIPR family protein [bacterium]
MSDRVVQVPVRWARRMPDPNAEGVQTHFMLVPVRSLPVGIPLDPNPRDQNINRPVYRMVGRSLRQEGDATPGSFHLKHRGITLIASKVTKVAKGGPGGLDLYGLYFPTGYGIVDGGHSYEIVLRAQDDEAVPDNEFIKLEVITGLDKESLVTDIAGGRNTSIQVHAKSLLDLGKKFDFLKDELARHGWANRVAWHENDDGVIDVIDVIARLSCFDIETYPDRHTHPVDAYRRKSSMLNRFQTHPERYERLVPIVRDVLYLHDWIAYDAEQRWRAVGGAAGTGSNYGRLEMVDHKKARRPSFAFPFLGDDVTSDNRLRPPVVLPILATFRLLLEPDPTADAVGVNQPVRWRNGFSEALTLWRQAGGRLLQSFYEHYKTSGRDLHVSGRSPALWRALCNEMVVSLGDHRQRVWQPDYAERLRIESVGDEWQIWHASFGQNRGEVATLAPVEDQDGVVLYGHRSQSLDLTALLRHTTPCEAARWVADRYNEESEKVARRLEASQRRYPLAHCRRAVDIAGLPKAINWLTDPAGLPTKIRHWANLEGPPAVPTRPGLPAHDGTDRQPGKPLIRGFLEIDCEQLGLWNHHRVQ